MAVFLDGIGKATEDERVVKIIRPRLAIDTMLQNLRQAEGTITANWLDHRPVIERSTAQNDPRLCLTVRNGDSSHSVS